MTTISIPMSTELRARVEARAAELGHADVSSYVESLILADANEFLPREWEAAVLKGLDSPVAPMTKKDWQDLRDEVDRRLAAQAAR